MSMNLETMHALKELVLEIAELKEKINELEDLYGGQNNKIRFPHRCPVCIGSTHDDKENALCLPCDGRGIVWG